MAEPLWSEDSFTMKERRKWDTPKNQGGMKCNGFEPYPRMLYKAQEHPFSHKKEVFVARDVISADKTVVLLDAEQFNASCQLTVRSEQEHNRARDDGWRDTPAEAIAYVEGLAQDMATAAAHRAYDDRNMSEKALAEAKAIEDQLPGHVPEIPEQRTDRMAAARAAKAAKKAGSTA